MAITLTGAQKRDLNNIFVKIAPLVGLTPLSNSWSLGDLIDEGLSIAGNLASNAANKGASLVALRDAANIIAATDVEGALAEIKTLLDNVNGSASAAVAVTNGGAGNSGKLFKLDVQGKAAGRVLETDGAKLDKFPSPGAVGRILYSDGTNYVELAAGASGRFLKAAGAAAPAWAVFAATDLPATVLGAPTTVSGAGAIDIVAAKSYLTSTAANQTNTLADGAYTGQIKRIVADASFDGTKTATITPTNGPAIVLVVAGDWVEYEWNGAAWAICGKNLQVQTGQITLVAGTKTINTGITIRGANTKIIFQMRTPGAGINGVQYKYTITAGVPGTGAFTVTAVDASAGGALVNTDISVLDYTIIN